jgi:hypothetical protein
VFSPLHLNPKPVTDCVHLVWYNVRRRRIRLLWLAALTAVDTCGGEATSRGRPTVAAGCFCLSSLGASLNCS